MLENILPIIILYNKKLEESSSYVSLLDSLKKNKLFLKKMFVYDNSKQAQTINNNESILDIKYFHNSLNSGVSKGFNVGIDYANKNNFEWVLLLDQDTNFDVDIMSKYLQNIEKYQDIKIFAPTLFYKKDKKTISPSLYLFDRGFAHRNELKEIISLKKYTPINSGCLINTEVFDAVGKFNEKIKLDFSDHELFNRIRIKYDNLGVVKTTNFHSLSVNEKNTFDSTIKRFNVFCVGAKEASKSKEGLSCFLSIALMRAVKLTIEFKSMEFIKTLVKTWY